MAKRTNRPQNLTVYLGAGEQREERIESLKRIAASMVEPTHDGKPAVSVLLQMIADGKIDLIPRDDKTA